MISQIEVPGLEKLRERLEVAHLAGEPMRVFGSRAGITVQGEARKLAPVDTGVLRSSIGYQVDSAPVPLWAKVGTSVFYAPYQELGTGTLAEGEVAGMRHQPPSEALDLWASRHGFASGREVARIIGRRGGLRPRRFLRGGLKASMRKIDGFVRQLAEEIERRFTG
jgi:hypothetical protein